MIDFGKLIFRRHEDKAMSWLRMAQLLLEGIRKHAVEGDGGDYEKFCVDMKNLESRLGPGTPAAEVLVLAGSAIKQIEDYNRGATRFLSAKANQVQDMVGMLTRTIGDVAEVDRESLARLKRIERRLEKASAIEDILAVKAHMEECLNHVREETDLRTAQVERLTDSLVKSGIRDQPQPDETRRLEQGSTQFEDHDLDLPSDPLTGLGRRQAALECFARALRAGQPQFVATLHIRQLSAVNNRYGTEVGDALLLAVRARLRSIVGDGDELFRWSGNSLVAALSRTTELNYVNWEVNRAVPKCTRESFAFKSRSIMLNLGVDTNVLRVGEFGAANEIESAIDRMLGVYADV